MVFRHFYITSLHNNGLVTFYNSQQRICSINDFVLLGLNK